MINMTKEEAVILHYELNNNYPIKNYELISDFNPKDRFIFFGNTSDYHSVYLDFDTSWSWDNDSKEIYKISKDEIFIVCGTRKYKINDFRIFKTVSQYLDFKIITNDKYWRPILYMEVPESILRKIYPLRYENL